MREILFRAWDKSKNEMIYSGVEFELRSISYPCKYGENNKFGSDSIGFKNINDKYFDIMQFTGVLDKNGVKIFDGDIVKVKGTKRVGEYITFIRWNNTGFRLDKNLTYLNDNILLPKSIEVIGNIHENKDLLI